MDLYDGWANPETQAVAIVLDSGEARLKRTARILYKAAQDASDHEERLITRFATALEQSVKDQAVDFYFRMKDGRERQRNAALFHNVGSLWRVDWEQIAKHLHKKFSEEKTDAP